MPKGFSDLSRAEGNTAADILFDAEAALRVGVCHTNEAQSLTVLGGSVSKHHPQVTAAHVFNGNCHLAGSREESGELRRV